MEPERQVHTGASPGLKAVQESIYLSHEIFTRVFRHVAREVVEKRLSYNSALLGYAQ